MEKGPYGGRGSEIGQRAIRISLVVSIVVFAIKFSGWLYTGANSVLSDAAESFVHVFAVGFSTFGVWLSQKPPDKDHLYGHERVGYFAVGAEGMLIMIATVTILYQSVKSLIFGTEIFNLEVGAAIVFVSALINLILGSWLVRTGKKIDNMIVIGNGRHTLTDVYTSAGVLITLLLVSWTGYLFLDAVVAIAIAGYISVEGYRLVSYSVMGLMDKRDSRIDKVIRKVLDQESGGTFVNWHDLRHRRTGSTTWVEFHAVFEKGIGLEEAHRQATILERKLMDKLPGHVVVTIHLEPEYAHLEHHRTLRDN
jgi:cation diffusion facilitator family transporter